MFNKRVFGLVATAVFLVCSSALAADKQKKETKKEDGNNPVLCASAPTTKEMEVVCAVAKKQKAKREIREADNKLHSLATSDEKVGLKYSSNQKKAIESLAEDRDIVLKYAALTGCKYGWDKPVYPAIQEQMEKFGKVVVPADGWARAGKNLYVIDDESGALIDPAAVGTTSRQAFSKVTIVPYQDGTIEMIQDSDLGRPVVRNLCPGNSVTLYKSLDFLRDKDRKNFEYLVTVRYKDGYTGTDRISVQLDQNTNYYNGGVTFFWKLNPSK
jgi:hypothetical protein